MILHITTHEQWGKSEKLGLYLDKSLLDEGFIHCSLPEQIIRTANKHYFGQDNLLLLCISPGLLKAPLIYEDSYGSGEEFPHIYGVLNLEAVLHVIDFPVNDDGSFTLPDAIKDLCNQVEAEIGRNASETLPGLQGRESILKKQYPILEFDPSPIAFIEPRKTLSPLDIAENCVLCFFQDVLSDLKEKGELRQVLELGSERGPNPGYEMIVDGQRLIVMHAGVGAPLSAAYMDELIALGCRKFVACGGCGVLDGQVDLGQAVIPVSAVRDEGTSYHYLPPAREVASSPEAVSAIQRTLENHHVPYVLGKTWTTDAPYRETLDKIALRRSEGCLTVEMETAAFCAVAQFRGVTFGQILYGGDDLSGENWDRRGWEDLSSTRGKLFWLAAEACLQL